MSGEAGMGTRSVQRHFDELAPRYVTNFAERPSARTFNFQTRLRLAVELAGTPGGRLLDVAAGTGEITAAVAQASGCVEADVADLTPAMLERARERMAAQGGMVQRFHQADAFTFEPPAGEGGYRLVMCLGLIAHTGRLPELLARLWRWLEPGGALLLQSTVGGHWGTRIVRALTERSYEKRHGYRISYFTLEGLRDAARAAGFEVAAARRFCTGVPFLDRVSPALGHWVERAGARGAERSGSEVLLRLVKPVA